MNESKTPDEAHGGDDDLLFTIAHALRYRGRTVTHDADQLIAKLAAERILEALKRSYVITPKPPAPLATIAQHPKMGRSK